MNKLFFLGIIGLVILVTLLGNPYAFNPLASTPIINKAYAESIINTPPIRNDVYETQWFGENNYQTIFGLPKFILNKNNEYKAYEIINTDTQIIVKSKITPLEFNKSDCTNRILEKHTSNTFIEKEYWSIVTNSGSGWQLFDALTLSCDYKTENNENGTTLIIHREHPKANFWSEYTFNDDGSLTKPYLTLTSKPDSIDYGNGTITNAGLNNIKVSFANIWKNVHITSINFDGIKITSSQLKNKFPINTPTLITGEKILQKIITFQTNEGNNFIYDITLGFNDLIALQVTRNADNTADMIWIYGKSRTNITYDEIITLDPTFGFSNDIIYGVTTTSSTDTNCNAGNTLNSDSLLVMEDSATSGNCDFFASEFDITVIPDGSNLRSAQLKLVVNTASDVNCDINPMSSQPNGATASNLETDINDGIAYIDNDSWCTTTGQKILTLPSAFVNDCEANLSSDWCAIGFTFNSITRDSLDHSLELSNIQLIIQYGTTIVPNIPTLNSVTAQTSQLTVNWTNTTNFDNSTQPVINNYTVWTGETLELFQPLHNWNQTQESNIGNITTSSNFEGIFHFDNGDATGGTVTYSGGKTIHTFTSSGTFTPFSSFNVEYLVVGGGGGGGSEGSSGRGAGGGAGGYRNATGHAVTAQAYVITVGDGGTGGIATANRGSQGSDSIFDIITSTGGGGGGSGVAEADGGSGGSGGGASPEDGNNHIGGAGNTPSTTPSQGNAGGAGSGTNQRPAGGGGGASAVGADATASTGGDGGAGTFSSISGSSVCYAGGGGGGIATGTAGTGTCGGGDGDTVANNDGSAGTTNTGGGGGGKYNGNGYAGGSGIVIISYDTIPYYDYSGNDNHGTIETLSGTAETKISHIDTSYSNEVQFINAGINITSISYPELQQAWTINGIITPNQTTSFTLMSWDTAGSEILLNIDDSFIALSKGNIDTFNHTLTTPMNDGSASAITIKRSTDGIYETFINGTRSPNSSTTNSTTLGTVTNDLYHIGFDTSLTNSGIWRLDEFSVRSDEQSDQNDIDFGNRIVLFTELATGLTVTPPASGSYADTSVGLDDPQCYYVTAWNTIGESPNSNILCNTSLDITTPSVPTNLVATASSISIIGLDWDDAPAVDNLNGYRIFMETPVGNGWTVEVANTTTTTSSYSDIGLTAKTQYNYMVAGINATGVGANSTASADFTFGVPDAVTSFSVTTATVSTLSLGWTASIIYDSPVTGHQLERESPIGGGFSVINADIGNVTSHTDTGLATVTEYNYRITPLSGLGNGATATVNGATVSDPPTNLLVLPNGTDTDVLLLTWVAPVPSTGVNGYQIEREAPVGGGFSIIVANTTNTTISYNNTGLVIDTFYNYRVAALTSDGVSEVGNTYSQTTFHLPDSVVTLTAIPSTLIDIVLTWTTPVKLYGYILGYMVNSTTPQGDPLTVLVNHTDSSTPIYTATNLDPSIVYSFRVSAITIHGGNISNANIANATASSEFIIGEIFLPTDSNPNTIPIAFALFTIDSDTKDLQVTYDSVMNLRCNFDYKFARTNTNYTGLTENPLTGSQVYTNFTINNPDNEIIDVNCIDQLDSTNTGKYRITQDSTLMPFVTQATDFQSGIFGTSGQFGAIDLVTLLVVIISMIGFNRVNPAVGVFLMIGMIGALSFYGIIGSWTIVLSALALIAMLAIITVKKT